MTPITVDKTFDLEKTIECGQCFHYIKTDDGYIIFGTDSVCKVVQNGTTLVLESDGHDYYWVVCLGLHEQYQKVIEYLTDWAQEQKDEFALEAIKQGTGIRIMHQSLFEICVSFIISQRNRIPRIQKAVFDLSEKYSSIVATLDGKEYKCFPSPTDLKRLKVEDYKALGLGYRSNYLYEFVQNWDNIKDRFLGNYGMDKAILKACKGIGDKVADCICLYGFHQFDAFPVDTWINKIIIDEYTSKGKELVKPPKYGGILQQFMFYTKRMQ